MWKNKSLRNLKDTASALSKPRLCQGNNPGCRPKRESLFADPGGKAAHSASKQHGRSLMREVEKHLSATWQDVQDGAEQLVPSPCVTCVLTALPVGSGRNGEGFCTSI